VNKPITIIQVGHSRDGLRNYIKPSRDKGYSIILIEDQTGKSSYAQGNFLCEPDFDETIFVDRLSLETLITTIKQIQKSYLIQLIIPGFELFTVKVADVCKAINLPSQNSISTIEKFRFKSLQRLALAEKIRQPKFFICYNQEDAEKASRHLGFPLVLKPDDSGGSMGVRLISNQEKLAIAFEECQKLTLDDGNPSNGIFLLEEYIEGAEVGIQGVVDKNGQVFLLGISKKNIHNGINNDQFMEQRHLVCSASNISDEVRYTVESAIKHLELKASPFHVDLRLSNEQPVLIETGARLSGAFVPRLLTAATNLDWGAIALDVQLGNSPIFIPSNHRFSAIEFITSSAYKYGTYHIFIPHIQLNTAEDISIILFPNKNQLNNSYHHISDRIGIIQVTADNQERVKQLLEFGAISVSLY
jgi:biotin carboxylase